MDLIDAANWFVPAVSRYLGLYTLVRGALYFLVGAGALRDGVGGVAAGSLASLGGAVFGVLSLSIAFALFLSGGLLLVKRKIGRLLAVLLLTVDTAFQLFEGVVGVDRPSRCCSPRVAVQ